MVLRIGNYFWQVSCFPILDVFEIANPMIASFRAMIGFFNLRAQSD
jgi:hypothetical protein